MSEIEDKHIITNLLADNFKIIGMPFFNEENRVVEFGEAIDEFANKI